MESPPLEAQNELKSTSICLYNKSGTKIICMVNFWTKIRFEYRVVIGYLILGIIWILLSDYVVNHVFDNNAVIAEFQMYKGWFFVIITSVFLYGFIRKHLLSRRKRERQLKDSDHLKTVFLQNISHEIRTPMNSIIGFSDLINGKDATLDEIQEYSHIIQNSSYKLLSVINDIIDISQIQSGISELNEEATDLNSLIVDLVTTFKSQAIASNIELKYTCGLPFSDCMIYADYMKLRRVFFNLINNAIKFTTSGSISIGYESKNNEIECFVKDTGTGIPPELLPNIFDRFYKTESMLHKLNQGTGLGLAICKGYIDKMNGKIWVETELQKGTTFYFTIPQKRIKRAKEPLKEQKISSLNNFVLIAEDDEMNYLYLREIFKQLKIKTLRALNGKDAVEQCRINKNIFLVLMDLKMPVLNGIEATEMIKHLRPNLPVVIQSAYAMENDYKLGKSIGCKHYLTKPISKEKLSQILDYYLN